MLSRDVLVPGSPGEEGLWRAQVRIFLKEVVLDLLGMVVVCPCCEWRDMTWYDGG